jgi:hypothetical protein
MDTVVLTIVWVTAFVASMAAVAWWEYRDQLTELLPPWLRRSDEKKRMNDSPMVHPSDSAASG